MKEIYETVKAKNNLPQCRIGGRLFFLADIYSIFFFIQPAEIIDCNQS